MDILIKQYEGCRLDAYPDPATGGEPWTIGWGSTSNKDGKPFKNGDTISQAMADALLTDYIMKNIVPVFQKIPYNLTGGQKSAIASLVYNIGVPAFLRSGCFKAICEKDIAGIYKNWDWIKANGKAMKGLAKRRANELYWYLRDL